MSTYRTGNHWGVTIVREGEHIDVGVLIDDDQLVAVVVNGDQELAELVCELLNAGPELMSLLSDLMDPDHCWLDHGGKCQAHGQGSDERCPQARIRELMAVLRPIEDAPSAHPVSPYAAEQGSGAGRDGTEAPGRSERATGPLVYETTKAIERQLRILGYSYPSVEWDGALAAARAWTDRHGAVS